MNQKKVNQINRRKKRISLDLVISTVQQSASIKEAAKKLGCSSSNIIQRLQRAKHKGIIYYENESIPSSVKYREDWLINNIGDVIEVPHSASFSLHQFSMKFPLAHNRYYNRLERYFQRCIRLSYGKKWKPQLTQTKYAVPLNIPKIGKTTLEWQKGSTDLWLKGLKGYGEDYNQARDRTILLANQVTDYLEKKLFIKFDKVNCETREGHFEYDPPKDSILKKQLNGLGRGRIGNLEFDDSKKNGGQVEVKIPTNEQGKAAKIKTANDLASLVTNSDSLVILPEKMDNLTNQINKLANSVGLLADGLNCVIGVESIPTPGEVDLKYIG